MAVEQDNLIAKKRILVADDEAYIRMLVKSILGRDYIVFEASDGEEAVGITQDQRPDLILMDIMMPKLDGVGACAIMKSSSDTREIPVVMLTARADKLDRTYAKDMGADGYMTKPFNPQELLKMVSHFLIAPESGR